MVTVMPDSGDFPHLAQPEAFAALMRDTGRWRRPEARARAPRTRAPVGHECGRRRPGITDPAEAIGGWCRAAFAACPSAGRSAHMLAGEGLAIGRDVGDPVTQDYPGERPYAFTGGTIKRVAVVRSFR